jgi:hypothetical protein
MEPNMRTFGRCEICRGAIIATSPGRWSCPSCRILAKCSNTDNPSACWVWKGAVRNNYGVVRVTWAGKYRTRNVHRVMYALNVGEVPDGVSVLHLKTCVSKLCCNPRHLHIAVQPIVLDAETASTAKEKEFQ